MYMMIKKCEERGIELTRDYLRSCGKNIKYHPGVSTWFDRINQYGLENDVIVAMLLGLSLQELLSIYRVQFPILQQHEKDTFYDANGRIVFAKNNALTGVGFDRKEWEGNVKGAPAGKVFPREIEDDTMPGGPVKRTIEYVAPFDKCDREQDYETAWRFFEEKYGK